MPSRFLPVLPFARLAYRDARLDPFFPASRLGACWFVLRHWFWLRGPSGPYAD